MDLRRLSPGRQAGDGEVVLQRRTMRRTARLSWRGSGGWRGEACRCSSVMLCDSTTSRLTIWRIRLWTGRRKRSLCPSGYWRRGDSRRRQANESGKGRNHLGRCIALHKPPSHGKPRAVYSFGSLHFAVSARLCTLLLSRGCDVNAKDDAWHLRRFRSAGWSSRVALCSPHLRSTLSSLLVLLVDCWSSSSLLRILHHHTRTYSHAHTEWERERERVRETESG